MQVNLLQEQSNVDPESYKVICSTAENTSGENLSDEPAATKSVDTYEQLISFGFPYTLNANDLTLISEGDFLEP